MRSWRVERMEYKNTKMVLFQDLNRFCENARFLCARRDRADIFERSSGSEGLCLPSCFRELPVDRHEELIRRAIRWPDLLANQIARVLKR
jgi:hypothetical protein